MVIRVFRSQYLIQYILLFLFTILLWSDALLFPEKLITGGGFENFDFITPIISAYPLVSIIISIFVLYFQAILLNLVVEAHRLVERNQLTTAAVYVLMMSSSPQMVQPNLMLLVNFLLILLLFTTLNLYGKNEPLSAVFDTGFLVGLASLLFLPAIYFIGFVLMSLIIFQLFKWREWLIPIIGLITPYIFLISYFFWFDQLLMKYQVFINSFTFRIPDITGISEWNIAIWILFSLLIITKLGKAFRIFADSTVDNRKKKNVVFYYLIFSILSIFFTARELIWYGFLLIIPLSIIISSLISKSKKLFVVELVFSMIIITVIIVKILNFS